MMTYHRGGRGAITPLVISTCSRCAGTWPLTANEALAAPGSSTSVANDIVYVPIWVPEQAVFVSAYIYNGSATAGNAEVGIYDTAGTKLGGTASTARSGNSAIQRIALSASVTLTPGRYYIATVTSTSAANITWAWAAVLNNGKWAGLLTQSNAGLPSPATFSTWSSKIVPLFGIGQQAF